MIPDLNRLKVFYFIYENQSVVLAARELHVTQSAVSQSLKKLEQELGLLLFTRMHRRLVPTQAGHLLAERVAPWMLKLEEGLRELHHSRDVPCGLLRLGAPVEFGQNRLPSMFADFRRRYPEVRFSLTLGHPKILLPMLHEGTLDFAFVDIFSGTSRWEDELAPFVIEPAFVEELILLGAREVVDALSLGDTPLEGLLQASFVAYTPQALSLKTWFRHHLGQKAPALELALVVESVRAAISAVEHQMGLAVVPSYLVRDGLREGHLKEVVSPKEPITNQISLVQLSEKYPTLTEKTFFGFCREALGGPLSSAGL